MSKQSRFKLSFILILAVVLLVVGFLAFGHVFRSEASISDERLVKVERGDLALTVVATGSIVPVATVEVKSKASGLVKQIYVEEGDRVSEGQILAELDKELLQAQLRESEANRLAVVAKREEAKSEHASARSLKKKMEMDSKNLEDRLAFHQRQVARFGSLFDEKLIPHSQLEEQERAYQDAHFALEAIKSELMMQDARIDAAEKAVSRVDAEVAQADAQVDRARENLHYATIRSPLSATVLKRHVEIGDAVSSILQLGSQATLMLTLGDMKEVFFEGRVDETDIGKVYVGQKGRVRVDAFRDNPFPGEVIRIAPLGEEKDNVIGFEVRVAIHDPDRILRAQMSANAEIIVEEKQEVLLIPEGAVIYDKDRKTFVDRFNPSAGQEATRVPIEVGISNGTKTEVVSGLEEGQQVVRADTGGLI